MEAAIRVRGRHHRRLLGTPRWAQVLVLVVLAALDVWQHSHGAAAGPEGVRIPALRRHRSAVHADVLRVRIGSVATSGQPTQPFDPL